MHLVIDIGNTRIKAAVFKGDSLSELFVAEKSGPDEFLKKIFDQYPEIGSMTVASVANLELVPPKKDVQIHTVDRKTKFPYRNLYDTPDTLGVDRMVLAAGAVLKFPGKNRLIIDAGTCITYDFVDDKDEYLGGAIAPGIAMRYKALNHYTDKLPLLTPSAPDGFIGKSTAGSIHSGIINGVVSEILGFIAECEKHSDNFIIILTGGDTEILAAQLKNTIFASPNFLLESLNALYQYNHE